MDPRQRSNRSPWNERLPGRLYYDEPIASQDWLQLFRGLLYYARSSCPTKHINTNVVLDIDRYNIVWLQHFNSRKEEKTASAYDRSKKTREITRKVQDEYLFRMDGIGNGDCSKLLKLQAGCRQAERSKGDLYDLSRDTRGGNRGCGEEKISMRLCFHELCFTIFLS